jgi:hypothetical protein
MAVYDLYALQILNKKCPDALWEKLLGESAQSRGIKIAT